MTQASAVRVAPPPEPLRPRTLRLRVHGESVKIARGFACDVATRSSNGRADLDDVALITSEMVTNGLDDAGRLAKATGHAWRYDDHPVHLLVTATDRYTLVSVRDAGNGLPERRQPTAAETRGRGMVIVDALTVAVWVTPGSPYKTVHALMQHPGIELTDAEIAAVRRATQPVAR